MNNKLGEKKSKDKIREEIDQIEKSIDDYINWRDIEEDIMNTQYNDIMQKIESCLHDIHETIFVKKRFLLLTSSQLNNLKGDLNREQRTNLTRFSLMKLKLYKQMKIGLLNKYKSDTENYDTTIKIARMFNLTEIYIRRNNMANF